LVLTQVSGDLAVRRNPNMRCGQPRRDWL